MKNNTPSHRFRTAAIASLSALVLFAGAACSDEPEEREPRPPRSTTSAAPQTTAAPEPTQAPSPQSPADTTGLLAPGESTASSGNVLFVGSDGQEAIFSHRVISIEPMSPSDVAAVTERAPQIAGSDLYIINIESSFVSGANLEYSSFSTTFRPIDPNFEELQYVAVSGFDFCQNDFIPSPGNDPSVVLSNCTVAIVPAGGPAPIGVAWDAYDTPYDSFGGTPAYFLLG